MNKLAALLLFLPIAAVAQVFGGGVGVTGGQQTYTNWPNPSGTKIAILTQDNDACIAEYFGGTNVNCTATAAYPSGAVDRIAYQLGWAALETASGTYSYTNLIGSTSAGTGLAQIKASGGQATLLIDGWESTSAPTWLATAGATKIGGTSSTRGLYIPWTTTESVFVTDYNTFLTHTEAQIVSGSLSSYASIITGVSPLPVSEITMVDCSGSNPAQGGSGTSIRASISGTTLTESTINYGTIAVGQVENAATVAGDTVIGSSGGSTWNVTPSQTVSAGTIMIAAEWPGSGGAQYNWSQYESATQSAASTFNTGATWASTIWMEMDAPTNNTICTGVTDSNNTQFYPQGVLGYVAGLSGLNVLPVLFGADGQASQKQDGQPYPSGRVYDQFGLSTGSVTISPSTVAIGIQYNTSGISHPGVTKYDPFLTMCSVLTLNPVEVQVYPADSTPGEAGTYPSGLKMMLAGHNPAKYCPGI